MDDDYEKEPMCPKCGWDSDGEDMPDNLEVTDHRVAGSIWDGWVEWVEHWTCPECGNKFSFENSG